MYKHAIDRDRGEQVTDSAARRGSVLVGTLVILVGFLGLLFAASTMSAVEVREARHGVDEVRTKYLAEAGAERGINFLAAAIAGSTITNPLQGATALFASGNTITPFVGEPVMNGTRQVGAYSVSLTALEQTATSITVAVDATGYLPVAPTDLPAGRDVEAWEAVRTTVRYSLAPSKVFDYGYFINNWGWFYGNTIHCKGNVRSNGQFDVAGYSPTVTGQPLYDAVTRTGNVNTLTGYQDDNGDGLANGNDGGVWSSWDIVGAQNLQGNGGLSANQHEFQDQVPMPNLSDLSQYEASATQAGGTIRIGTTTLSNAVYGDQAGERQNLYLVGTATNPIVLNGPVVVRGHVMIQGYVTGQGAIYAGGNVYCPKSVQYLNPPTTTRPANNTQAATEAWLSTNWDKDFLGLFAREQVVIGDFSHSTWQYYESLWMADPLNSSAEDAGADGIPNTRAGRDGVLGTADDDVLEGDGVFTVEHYSAEDQALGLIPPGKNVGDAIPGTGEDIDGDGIYDPQTTLSTVLLSSPPNSTSWGGNLPSGGVSTIRSIASINANNLDAVFYTNHSFCWTVIGSQTARINGALVSRNENIIYGTPSIEINYDCRLLGGSSGRAASLLPRTIQPMEVLRWTKLDRDPNRYVVHP